MGIGGLFGFGNQAPQEEILAPISEKELQEICNEARDLEVPPKGAADEYVPYADPLYDADGKPYGRNEGRHIEKIVWHKDVTAFGDPEPLAVNYFTALESDLMQALRAVVGNSRKENILTNAGAWLRQNQKLRAFNVTELEGHAVMRELSDTKPPSSPAKPEQVENQAR